MEISTKERDTLKNLLNTILKDTKPTIDFDKTFIIKHNKAKNKVLDKVVDKMLSNRKDEFVLPSTKEYEYATSDLPAILNKFIHRSDFGVLIYENSMDYGIDKKNISMSNRHEIKFTDLYNNDFNNDIEKLLDVGMTSGLVIMTNQTTTKYIRNLLKESGKSVDVLISFVPQEDFNAKYKIHVSFPIAEGSLPFGTVEESVFV